MPFNILFPDSRSDPLDIEREVAGPDTTLVNARKDRFEAVELSAWQNCDAIITRFVPIDAKVIPHLKRTRIVVRNGFTHDLADLLLDDLRRVLARLQRQTAPARGPEAASFSHGTH